MSTSTSMINNSDVSSTHTTLYPYCYRNAEKGNESLGLNENYFTFFFERPLYDDGVPQYIRAYKTVTTGGTISSNHPTPDTDYYKDEMIGLIFSHDCSQCFGGQGHVDERCMLCIASGMIRDIRFPTLGACNSCKKEDSVRAV